MKKILSIIAATAITSSALCAQSSTTISIGGTYSEGNFGTENTTKTYYVPVVAAYQNGMFSASVTVPYLRIDSEGSFTWTSGGAVPISPAKPGDFSNISTTESFDPFNPPSSTTTTKTQTQTSGLGDVTLNIGYTFVPATGLYIKTSALMKVATADDKKGLGTGEHDYSAQLDLYKIIGKGYVFVSGGYTLTGDSDITEYNDVWYASTALGYNVSNTLSAGVNYSYRQALFDTVDDTQSVSPYLSYKISKGFKLDASYAHGLSNASADSSYTLTLSQKF